MLNSHYSICDFSRIIVTWNFFYLTTQQKWIQFICVIHSDRMFDRKVEVVSGLAFDLLQSFDLTNHWVFLHLHRSFRNGNTHDGKTDNNGMQFYFKDSKFWSPESIAVMGLSSVSSRRRKSKGSSFPYCVITAFVIWGIHSGTENQNHSHPRKSETT